MKPAPGAVTVLVLSQALPPHLPELVSHAARRVGPWLRGNGVARALIAAVRSAGPTPCHVTAAGYAIGEVPVFRRKHVRCRS